MRQKRRVAQLLKSHIGRFDRSSSGGNKQLHQRWIIPVAPKRPEGLKKMRKKSIVTRISKARQIYLKLFFLPLQYTSLTFKYLQLFIERTLPYLSLKECPAPWTLPQRKRCRPRRQSCLSRPSTPKVSSMVNLTGLTWVTTTQYKWLHCYTTSVHLILETPGPSLLWHSIEHSSPAATCWIRHDWTCFHNLQQ